MTKNRIKGLRKPLILLLILHKRNKPVDVQSVIGTSILL